jgi:hypothetical protein
MSQPGEGTTFRVEFPFCAEYLKQTQNTES